jgi:glyoxylase-like metal-dependent hydrolase (beta-lactamase superfamily II)
MISRRAFLGGSAVAIVGGAVAPRWARAWQQQPPQVTPVFTDVRRNVGFFTGRGGTMGYLVDAKGVAVVDSQFPDSAKLFLEGLNQRSKDRPVDRLINTHHHGDHTGGNIVFKGSAKKVVAHAKAAEHMKAPPGGNPPKDEQLYPDATFTDVWREQVGDEWIRAKHYGRAHTSGDAVITFERANVAHLGDLGFNQRHPVTDGPAGATVKGWVSVLEAATKDHNNDTIYIFGHSLNATIPVTGNRADVLKFRDYLTAVLTFIGAQIKTGKPKDEILAMRDPLAGFESYGQFGMTGAREIRTVAYEELGGK